MGAAKWGLEASAEARIAASRKREDGIHEFMIQIGRQMGNIFCRYVGPAMTKKARMGASQIDDGARTDRWYTSAKVQ